MLGLNLWLTLDLPIWDIFKYSLRLLYSFYFKKKEFPAKNRFCAWTEIILHILGWRKLKWTQSFTKIFQCLYLCIVQVKVFTEKKGNSLKIKRMDSKFTQGTIPQENHWLLDYNSLLILLRDPLANTHLSIYRHGRVCSLLDSFLSLLSGRAIEVIHILYFFLPLMFSRFLH